jgi:hypothetical protein
VFKTCFDGAPLKVGLGSRQSQSLAVVVRLWFQSLRVLHGNPRQHAFITLWSARSAEPFRCLVICVSLGAVLREGGEGVSGG